MKYSANQIKEAIQEILSNYDSENGILDTNKIDFNKDINGMALGIIIFRGYILNIRFTNYRLSPGQHLNHLDSSVPDINTKLTIEPTNIRMSLNKPNDLILFNSYDEADINETIYKILNTPTSSILISSTLPLDLTYNPFTQRYSMAIGLIISRGYMTNLSLSNNELTHNTFMLNINDGIYKENNTTISISPELSSKGHIFLDKHINI